MPIKTPPEFREDLDTHKTRMNGLSYGEESMTIIMFSRFDTIPACDRQTDRQTSSLFILYYAIRQQKKHKNSIKIAITCVSLLTHVKNINFKQLIIDFQKQKIFVTKFINRYKDKESKLVPKTVMSCIMTNNNSMFFD